MNQPDSVQSQQSDQQDGTYQVLRQRLEAQAADLQQRLQVLNAARTSAFGTVRTELIGNHRLSTEHHCVISDIVAVGDYLLLGSQVRFGLKSEPVVPDIFTIYRRQQTEAEKSASEDEFLPARWSQLCVKTPANAESSNFDRDFHDLFAYYKNARFARFVRRGDVLFFVFQVGRAADEIKVFKWLIDESSDGVSLRYIDNRSEDEFRLPAQHDFQWTATSRDDHHYGNHPHVSICDRIFVETIGGDLTIKVENNTDTGEGIYAEPVDDPDQTLDDGEIFYAEVGSSIVLKIRPYQEESFRYIVVNDKLPTALRLDSIHSACVSLPDGQGLIFPEGYYLQSGEYKTFDHSLPAARYERTVTASNGEDSLYVFYDASAEAYLLLQYNLIDQRVDTPIICRGWTLFADGRLLVTKSNEDPQRQHAVQVWQTPYGADELASEASEATLLDHIGHRDLVKAIAQCHDLLQLARRDEHYSGLYTDLQKRATDVLDAWFWLDRDEVGDLAEPLRAIRSTAGAAIDEYERISSLRQDARLRVSRLAESIDQQIAAQRLADSPQLQDFVAALKKLREFRGMIVNLAADALITAEMLTPLEQRVEAQEQLTSENCIQFLLQSESLKPYEQRIEEVRFRIDELETAAAGRELQQKLSVAATDLELLIEITGNLQFDDATDRTEIVDRVSLVFRSLNQTRASLDRTASELARSEGAAEFQAQMELLAQAVANQLDVCDTAQKCQTALNRTVIQLENLESRFADVDEFRDQLQEKADRYRDVFEARRLQLVEQQQQRLDRLVQSAERMLQNAQSRAERLATHDEVSGFFAADVFVERIRRTIEELRALDAPVRADGLQQRLVGIQEDVIRQLRDRLELFVDGQPVLKLGRHRFSVQEQAPELTTVVRDDHTWLHVSGTQLFRPLKQLDDFADVCQQQLVSENAGVYRAEYLAWQVLKQVGEADTSTDASLSTDSIHKRIQGYISEHPAEGYAKGVHDEDAVRIVAGVVTLRRELGLQRFAPNSRSLAMYWWQHCVSKELQDRLRVRMAHSGVIGKAFRNAPSKTELIAELAAKIQEVPDRVGERLRAKNQNERQAAAEYLYEELSADGQFAFSGCAAEIRDQFLTHLAEHELRCSFDQTVQQSGSHVEGRFVLIHDWLSAFASTSPSSDPGPFTAEAVLLLMREDQSEASINCASDSTVIEGCHGDHTSMSDGSYRLQLHDYEQRLRSFEERVVPRFREFHSRRQEAVSAARSEIRLEDLRPVVLSSFVRNRLINDVYLPLIGDNLARQLGTADAADQAAQMGLLLLLSPPGYGKTTLLEYVAQRLGLIFVKINGPALGDQVRSLDPAEAPDTAAREEIEKLNLALELGDNVMLYVDDIQHLNASFLQKFISLCDGQRKIEGVRNGQAESFDLRGRKFCVVMAGNPYTESGHRFQVPDMLANRADVYNLGEVTGAHRDVFELSYLENAAASNPVLKSVARSHPQDIAALAQIAAGLDAQTVRLEGRYSLQERDELVNALKRLTVARDELLKINHEYIRSASQQDDDRTEPAFRLQGSYRNMNRLAEHIVPVMTDDEVTNLIVTQYQNDAQTLSSDTEANLLKFRELLGLLTDEEQDRWKAIRETFRRNTRLRGFGSDQQISLIAAGLTELSDELRNIGASVAECTGSLATSARDDQTAMSEVMVDLLQQVNDGLTDLRTTIGASNGMHDSSSSDLNDERPSDSDAAAPAIRLYAREASQSESRRNGKDAAGNGHYVSADPSAMESQEVPTEVLPADSSGQVTVVNRIPTTMVSVLKHQFRLMQRWLEPMHAATMEQQTEMRRLRDELNECVRSYRHLIDRIEAD